MWPFDIFAKRRELEAQQRREEEARRLQRVTDSTEASERRRLQFQANLMKPSTSRSAAAAQRPAGLRAVPPITQSSFYNDPLSPINPLSPLSPLNQVSQFSMWSVPDEPRHSSPSHCDTSTSHSSHSSSDYSSHSHSGHDHSCSSSSYDSGSSSSGSDF